MVLLSFLLIFASCKSSGERATGEKHTHTTELEFLENLDILSSKSYYGKVLFPEQNEPPFDAETLFVSVGPLTDGQIRMPFILGADRSRTWILTLTDEGLLFKHDHRHSDGTPEEVTMYGGFSDGDGTGFFQNFPADEETAIMIPEASTNVWTFRLNQELTELHYILERHNAPRFHAVFDLTLPFQE